eukprot:851413-Prymnesium_polylepis.1
MRIHLARRAGAKALDGVARIVKDVPFVRSELTRRPVGAVDQPPGLSCRRMALDVVLASRRGPRGAHNAPRVL